MDSLLYEKPGRNALFELREDFLKSPFDQVSVHQRIPAEISASRDGSDDLDSEGDDLDLLDLDFRELVEELTESIGCLIEVGPTLTRLEKEARRNNSLQGTPASNGLLLEAEWRNESQSHDVVASAAPELEDYWILRIREAPQAKLGGHYEYEMNELFVYQYERTLERRHNNGWFHGLSATVDEIRLVNWLNDLAGESQSVFNEAHRLQDVCLHCRRLGLTCDGTKPACQNCVLSPPLVCHFPKAAQAGHSPPPSPAATPHGATYSSSPSHSEEESDADISHSFQALNPEATDEEELAQRRAAHNGRRRQKQQSPPFVAQQLRSPNPARFDARPASKFDKLGDDEQQDPDVHSAYCYCGRGSYGEMVACDNLQCPFEWFHLECIHPEDARRGKEKWYCRDCRPAIETLAPMSQQSRPKEDAHSKPPHHWTDMDLTYGLLAFNQSENTRVHSGDSIASDPTAAYFSESARPRPRATSEISAPNTPNPEVSIGRRRRRMPVDSGYVEGDAPHHSDDETPITHPWNPQKTIRNPGLQETSERPFGGAEKGTARPDTSHDSSVRRKWHHAIRTIIILNHAIRALRRPLLRRKFATAVRGAGKALIAQQRAFRVLSRPRDERRDGQAGTPQWSGSAWEDDPQKVWGEAKAVPSHDTKEAYRGNREPNSWTYLGARSRGAGRTRRRRYGYE